MTIKLSPKALSTFKSCPHCFWLEKVKKIKRPTGIFPSLPGGMDSVIKFYFDGYRRKGIMPPELQDLGVKLFPEFDKLHKWRNWRASDLTYTDPETGATLNGAIDDLLMTEKGLFVPFDFKTRGTAHKESPIEYSQKYYSDQMAAYALMLDDSGYPAADYAYFAYYWPENVAEKGIVTFHIEMVKMPLDMDTTLELFGSAVDVLLHPEIIPASNPGCDYCNYITTRGGE